MLHRSFFRVDRNNEIDIRYCFASSCKIIIKGYGNKIIVDKGLVRLKKCRIYINGNNNLIRISSGCVCKNVEFYLEDDNNEIIIAPDVQMTGNTHLAAIEGTKIEIGSNCLFSQNITIRTGDSHSILDDKTRIRLNPSQSVKVGDHCWIGHSVTILKGTIIGEDSVVATGAVLTGKSYPVNCIVGGIPAKVLKSGINWSHERI